MTFKKTEMAKTLKNGLIKTNPLNHNWSHSAILLGLTFHQLKKNLLLRATIFRTSQIFEIVKRLD